MEKSCLNYRMENSFIILISYLMGSIPFGFILTKIFLKKDIRNIGSGNIGATNALRTGNKYIGYGTLALDVLKAVVTLIIIKLAYH
jgi:glycerol-3-phosphate acyltransferase PlsY